MELDDTQIDYDPRLEMDRKLESLALAIQDALMSQAGPRDNDATARLLEMFAQDVRNGKI